MHAPRLRPAHLLAALLLAVPARAQQRPPQPGEMLQMEGGEAYRIIRCHGTTEWDDCEVQAYYNGRPNGNPGRMTIRNLRAGEQRRRDAEARAGNAPAAAPRPAPPAPRPAPPRAAAPAAPRPPAGRPAGADGRWRVGDRLEVYHRSYWYPARIVAIEGGRYRIHYEGYGDGDDAWVDASRMRPIGGQVAAACTYTPPGPAITGATPFSEALARRRIFDSYSWRANGTGGAPRRVGVTFMEVRTQAPYRNTPRGGDRPHGGAPVGATVYPLRSKHMVCEEYPDGVKRRIVQGTFACFRDRDGAWTCPSENDTRITNLDQE